MKTEPTYCPYTLAPKVQTALETIVADPNILPALAIRTQVVLALGRGLSAQETAHKQDIALPVVVRCRRNWLIRNTAINQVLPNVSAEMLAAKLKMMLTFLATFRYLRNFSEAELACLLQLYATDPQIYGYARWRPFHLHSVAQQQQISCYLSITRVRMLHGTLVRWESKLLGLL